MDLIDYLRVPRGAQFSRIATNTTERQIRQLFRDLREAAPAPSKNHFYHVREKHAGARWSAISFTFDRVPSFLPGVPDVRERICGFLTLIEYREHLAVVKSALDLTASFKTRHLTRVSNQRVEGAVASGDAIFEKIRLRNTSISKLAMRTKTLEANDLSNAVGPAGSNRYASQAFAVRRGTDHFSATPRTGRVAQRSDRIDVEEIVIWAKLMIDQLVNQGTKPAPFLRTFAASLDLSEIEGQAEPRIFAVSISDLVDLLEEPPQIRLVRPQGEHFVALDLEERAALLEMLGQVLMVSEAGKVFELVTGAGDVVGSIAINKARIALRALDLPGLSDVLVERADVDPGSDKHRVELRRYIDQEELFTLLFDDLSLAYIDGTLFRDSIMADGGGNFLRYIRSVPALATTRGEKGKFSTGQTEFEEGSVFRAVVDHISAGDDILICDDLGDEWADFIGLRTAQESPQITFYHAKHGDLSLGAAPFHVSVSQAIKNLGRLRLPQERMASKLQSWAQPYANDKVTTSISKVVRGDPAALANAIAEVRSAPDVRYQVAIVTSSLSRTQVSEILEQIAEGEMPSPHFVQLYQLLASYFSACAEVGAFGYVVCQE